MNMLTRACLFLALLCFAVPCSLPLRAAESDHPEIRSVIESFRTSIIERDKPRFLNLFLEGNVTWQSVWEDETFSRIKVKYPPAKKARFNPDNSYIAFADDLTKGDSHREETFSNIKIDSDGDVAAVVFDYVFLLDGRETNRGKECWLMVRTESGWKITSVVWSKILPKPSEASSSQIGA